MKLLRITDKDGNFIRDDFHYTEDELGLDVEASQGLYKPRYDFELGQWVESADQEYIDSLQTEQVKSDDELLGELSSLVGELKERGLL
jgi:hypothetical protein